jgi:hypothetical protein
MCWKYALIGLLQPQQFSQFKMSFSMEIVMLVSWAIWTTRNDFIVKGYRIKHKSAGQVHFLYLEESNFSLRSNFSW